jgi:hypothetical protein
MPDPERPWYFIDHQRGSRPLKHTFAEPELPKALGVYTYVRRDLPNGRIEIRWAEDGLPPHGEPFDGQVWVGDKMVAQHGGRRVALLLHHLREQSAAQESGLKW